MTQSLQSTNSRIIMTPNVNTIKRPQLRLSRSKRKLRKVETTAVRDRMRTAGATATTSTVTKRGMLVINCETLCFLDQHKSGQYTKSNWSVYFFQDFVSAFSL